MEHWCWARGVGVELYGDLDWSVELGGATFFGSRNGNGGCRTNPKFNSMPARNNRWSHCIHPGRMATSRENCSQQRVSPVPYVKSLWYVLVVLVVQLGVLIEVYKDRLGSLGVLYCYEQFFFIFFFDVWLTWPLRSMFAFFNVRPYQVPACQKY